ncbi:MAG: hypothetical protein MUO76_03855 [Anaerolineaceae bacterium]|nr:hypothetical protein [Anaerolineaceae bacterium]
MSRNWIWTRIFKTLRFVFLLGLMLPACNSSGTTPASSPAPSSPPTLSYEDLVFHYAPVIYQGTASDQDYITAFDFDGDWIGANNWENQSTGNLAAYVYYSIIETETHWFIFYSVFHPRDYTKNPCEESDGCHENDLESIQLVVIKDETPFGNLAAVETLAHSDIFLYPIDSSVKPNALKTAGQGGQVKFEGSHPIIYIETYGHGIYATRKILLPGKIVYRVGDVAEVPEGIKDDHVDYQLVLIYDTLWAHRDEMGPGQAFDQSFDYRGRSLPFALDGVDFGEDRANTPWGYNQAIGDILDRGDWFLDPAKALAYHASFDGDFSGEYLYNPYLADLDSGSAP